jgi:SAM-dependent methyltransferase
VHLEVTDIFFGVPGTWSLRRCTGCGTLWLDPRPMSDDLHLAYRSYYTHGAGDALAPGGHRAKAALRRLPAHHDDGPGALAHLGNRPPGRVLDVGCGDGRTLLALAEHGWETVGVDADPASVDAARARGCPDVRVGTIDLFRDTPAGFDAVVLSHIVEHVEDPVALLTGARSLLRSGGVVSVLTPNAESWLHQRHGSTWRGLEPPRHLQVLTSHSLELLLTKSGFTDFQIRTSTRGANAMVRERAGATRGRATNTVRHIGDYAAGEFWQLAEAVRMRRHPDCGEELVALASAHL